VSCSSMSQLASAGRAIAQRSLAVLPQSSRSPPLWARLRLESDFNASTADQGAAGSEAHLVQLTAQTPSGSSQWPIPEGMYFNVS
jgi:hypothetical protein